MYLAHLVEGCQINDSDATSRHTDRMTVAARGASNSKICSFAARPAVFRDQLCQLAGSFSLRDEFTPPSFSVLNREPFR